MQSLEICADGQYGMGDTNGSLRLTLRQIESPMRKWAGISLAGAGDTFLRIEGDVDSNPRNRGL